MREYNPDEIYYGEGKARRTENGTYIAGEHILSEAEADRGIDITSAINTEMIMRTELGQRIEWARSALEKANTHKEKHGHFPKNFNLVAAEKNLVDAEKAMREFDDSIARQYSDDDGCLPVLVLGSAAGLGIGTVMKHWDTIVNTAIMVGTYAIGGAAIGAAGVGTFFGINRIFEKVTGNEAPIKSALTTAALFATVAGGVYYANQPQTESESTASPSATALAENRFAPGFYKAANDSAYVFDAPNGPYRYVNGISSNTCVRVSENDDAREFVRIDIIGAERALFDPGDKYAFKKELRPAPECRAF